MAPSKSTIKRSTAYNLRSGLTRLRSGMRNKRNRGGTSANWNVYGKWRGALSTASERLRDSVSAFRRKRSAASRRNASRLALSSDTISCAICLDTERSRQMEHIPCGHSFHAKCCEKWLSRSSMCPVCRTPVVSLPLDPAASATPPSTSRRNRRRRRHVLIRQRFRDMLLSSASIIVIDVYRFRPPPSR